MLLLTGFSLGCLTILFIIVARDFGRLPVARAFLGLLVAAGAFLLNNVISPEWKWLTSDIMTMLPALFWLICQLAFARRPRLVSVWSALAVLSFVVPSISRPFGASSEMAGALNFWAWKLPTYAEYVVILHGMWVVISGWPDDLIASRRRLRGALLGIVGIAALWVTVSLNTGYGSVLSLPFVVGGVTVIVASLVLTGRKGVLLGLSEPAVSMVKLSKASVNAMTEELASKDLPDKPDEALNEASQKLKQTMIDGFYRTEKLTLKQLSEKIEFPEYKTRALINETLGYRNFNDYINQLRIAEACEKLVTEPDMPILNIALDVGYRTLSSFNRAFKDILEQTPTAYRQTEIEAQNKA